MNGHTIGEIILGSILVALVLYAIYLQLDNKRLRHAADDLRGKNKSLEGNVIYYSKLYSDLRIKDLARQELENTNLIDSR